MTQIIQQLGPELKKGLKEAEEVWIAVALMSEEGLQIIQEFISEETKLTIIVGINLPTHPKVLESLFKEDLLSDNLESFLHRGKFYHPKLYLIRRRDGYVAFIGSANATSGGYQKNVELSVIVDCSQKEFDLLLQIISEYQKSSIKLTKNFIDKYKKAYSDRQKLLKEEEKLAQKELKDAEDQVAISDRNRRSFVNDLKRFRRSQRYQVVLEERNEVIQELKESLDYPIFEDIEVQQFFDIWELGHLLQLPKPRILDNMDMFKGFLHYLINDDIDMSIRYQEAYEGDYQIKGVSKAFISKILTIHDPINNWIQNSRTLDGLELYGLELPRGLTSGEKYKITARFLRSICVEADIANMAVLDYFLYEKANNNL